MMMSARAFAVGATLGACLASNAAAEHVTLDFEAVAARVLEESVEARSAEQRVAIARAAMEGADIFAQENPQLSVGLGPRLTSDTTEPQAAFSFTLPVEVAGERQRRRDVVSASVRVEEGLAALEQLRVVAAAASAFCDVLYGRELVELAVQREAIAVELVSIVQARRSAEGATELELELVQGERLRAKSQVQAANAALERSQRRLGTLVGLPAGVAAEVSGSLGERARFDRAAALAPSPRPELAVIAAEGDAARAELALADAEAFPDFALSLSYGLEEGEHIVLAGVQLTLPVSNSGQGPRAVARERSELAELRADGYAARLRSEWAAATAAYLQACDIVEATEEQVLPQARAQVLRALDAYTHGKIDLATFFVIRREEVNARTEHLEQLREAAIAGVQVWVAAGAPLTSGELP